MSIPLRVLILEDRAADADLMVHELERAGYKPQWKRVETAAEYLAQLKTLPDIILADHTLPQFGAPEALEILKSQGLDIPCIIVTGSISEEAAVKRMKEGAADYILKDRMVRLGPAVQHALDEKKLRDEKRKAGEEVRRALEQTKKQAMELEKANIELEKANKAKDEFLSVISHELRTPLTVALGYIGVMEDGHLGEVNQRQRETLRKITQRNNDLLFMINSILQATSIEANAVTVESHDIRLQDFLNEMRSAYDIPRDKELSLHWDYPAALPLIKTDGEKLGHILQHLINNAIKFTHHGTVTVSVRHIPEAKRVEFKVADTGVGIPKNMFPVIFERFRQADSSKTRLYDGLGLGLYIVKRFTELLRGKVEVESEPGKGSIFTVTLPMKTSL